MELYQLRYFLAVAETGNFTKAAQRSFISQPSLSQQILNLEEEFGQKLFHRLGRKAVLTEAGKTLLDGARRILTEADHTLAELKNDPLLGPEVHVGAIQTVAPFFIPAVLAYCRANDVRLSLHTHEDFRRSLIEEVYNGKLDWALVSLPLNEPRLHIEKLYSEPLWLAIGAGHPLARAEHIKFADLRNETFILLGEASTLALQIQRFCGEHDFEPRIGHRCGQLATVKAFAAMGLGVSVLPQSARSATDPEGLVFRKFSGIAPSRDIALVRHRGRHLGAGANLFAEIARAVVGPVPVTGSTAPFQPAAPAAT
ncbi:MAG: LysR family transcriptional regulator [bacterium]|nr:LysR family transcriptional regulator [bacterium]MDI1334802.1 LysR family transcriptional regulator [Lacunisphaera sp.]